VLHGSMSPWMVYFPLLDKGGNGLNIDVPHSALDGRRSQIVAFNTVNP